MRVVAALAGLDRNFIRQAFIGCQDFLCAGHHVTSHQTHIIDALFSLYEFFAAAHAPKMILHVIRAKRAAKGGRLRTLVSIVCESTLHYLDFEKFEAHVFKFINLY